MGISLKTQKALWGKAASRCSFPECRKELAQSTEDELDHFTIGDVSHIISGKESGPRSRLNRDYPLERIDDYNNLILLCKAHHKQVDSDETRYTVEELLSLKRNHENWVRENLNFDQQQQKDDELYAEYIDVIENLANFNDWENWTEPVMGGYSTRIAKVQFDNLLELHKYISSRYFSGSRPKLKMAIEQFNTILKDFINHFRSFILDDPQQGFYLTAKLFRSGVITSEKQTIHEHMSEQFIIELTKSANYLFEQVRYSIFPRYRIKEGILLLYSPPCEGLSFQRHQYAENEIYAGYSTIKERTKLLLHIK